MGKIKTFTGLTSDSIRIEQKISKILITSNKEVINEKISVSYTDGQGSNDKTFIPQQKILHLAEINARSVTGSEHGYFVNKTADAKILLDIGFDNSTLELINNQAVNIDLTSLDATATYNIYAIETPFSTDVLNGIYQDVVKTNQTQLLINTDSIERLFVVKQPDFLSVDVTVMGKTTRYTNEELTALEQVTDDLIVIKQTEATFGLNLLLEIPFAPIAEEIRINTSGSSDVIYYKIKKEYR